MVKIIDAMCGAGKTSYIFQYMNEHPEKKFIYITPFLDEFKTLKKKCILKFCEPLQLGIGKYDSFKKLLEFGTNIMSTHSLFKQADKDICELIEASGYTLVLDEVMDVVEQINLKKSDLQNIINNYAHIDDKGILVWDDYNYSGRFDDIKNMSKSNNIFMVNDCCLVWKFPAIVFKSFTDVFVLTFLFKYQIQKYYYDMNNIEYSYNSVEKENNKFVLTDLKEYTIPLDLITIYEGSLNSVGDNLTSLSKTWFNKYSKTKVSVLKRNVSNYYRHIEYSPSKFNMWTTFKDYRGLLSSNGYSRGFLASNIRSSNEYRSRYNIAYCINKYLSPLLKLYFQKQGIEVDEEGYAYSEMIQFIFRSRIRDGKTVKIYIPSYRMRSLLIGSGRLNLPNESIDH